MSSPYQFSFSGLKTAVLRTTQELCGVGFDFPSYKLSERLSEAQKADLAASFQHIAIETLVDKAHLAFDHYKPSSMVIAGGVAANQELRRYLSERISVLINYTDIKLCTDNAAMIASLGFFMATAKQPPADAYTLTPTPSLSM